MIPQPFYSLINTSRGHDPAVVVVNSALRDFKERDAFSWHLKLILSCKYVGENDMPTHSEVEVLNKMEEGMFAALQDHENAMFFARVTCRGTRELLYRVHDPRLADGILQQLISTGAPVREWEYEMRQDRGWELAEPEFDLLRSASQAG